MLSTSLGHARIAYSIVEDGSASDRPEGLHKLETFSHKPVAFMLLVHKTDIFEVTVTTSQLLEEADAVWTRSPGVVLGMRIGDCLPIAVLDEKTGIIALIHGGWKSLTGNIIDLTLNALKKAGSNPQDLQVWIGPSLRSCCNLAEGPITQAAFPEWQPYLKKEGEKTRIDLQGFAIAKLVALGIPKSSIIDSGECTYHDGRFFSHWRSKQTGNEHDNGRFVVGIWRET